MDLYKLQLRLNVLGKVRRGVRRFWQAIAPTGIGTDVDVGVAVTAKGAEEVAQTSSASARTHHHPPEIGRHEAETSTRKKTTEIVEMKRLNRSITHYLQFLVKISVLQVKIYTFCVQNFKKMNFSVQNLQLLSQNLKKKSICCRNFGFIVHNGQFLRSKCQKSQY